MWLPGSTSEEGCPEVLEDARVVGVDELVSFVVPPLHTKVSSLRGQPHWREGRKGAHLSGLSGVGGEAADPLVADVGGVNGEEVAQERDVHHRARGHPIADLRQLISDGNDNGWKEMQVPWPALRQRRI